MLSREDRILSELIVGRGLATPEAVERRARELEDSNEHGLVQAMVSQGELDPETGRQVHEEAREISDLLRADLPDDKTLGEFRLLREIGRGGMGIVYEAEQPSLGRRVALKVLPAGAALDERLAIRFLREARTAARLNHPGIVPVFGTGREQGVLFFAMELVDGTTLAERIARGPLPPLEAARVASEIAHALQHAHEAGLIHRDVKPENVMLGSDGRTRLADFGLVHDLQGARLTRSQYVLGTPAYSAPEQARGAPVDPRSDVYGAGAVLYAMICGNPPFAGEVPAAVLGRLVNEAPPTLAKVAPETPPALIAICEKAMARDADRRYTTAAALAEALDHFLEHGESAPVPRQSRSGKTWGLVAGIVSAAAMIAAAWLFGFRDSAPSPPTAVTAARVGLLRGTLSLFPTPPGPKRYGVLSPDGKSIAYTMGGTQSRIYVQADSESEPWRLAPETQIQSSPTWSPDGERIAYCRSRHLAIVDLASGALQTTDSACGTMDWSPDGRSIVHAERQWPQSRLRVVDLESGTSRLISPPGSGYPSWSADGRIAFVALRDGQYDLWTSRDDGSDLRRATADAGRELQPVWSSIPGRLYYASNQDDVYDLWQVDLEPSTGEVLIGPRRVTHGWIGEWFSLSAARERERLAFVQTISLARCWALGLGPGFEPSAAPRRLRTEFPCDTQLPHKAADREDWVVVIRRGDAENLHRFLLDGSDAPITEGSYRDAAPRWSPDGSSIAFHSDRSGKQEIWTVGPDGSGLSQLTRTDGDARFPVWSPDGRSLVYSVDGAGPSRVTLADREMQALETEEGWAGFEAWSWSADGGRLAGTAAGIVVLDLASGRYTRVTDYGEKPVWAAESGGLLFTHEDRIFHWDGNAKNEPRAIWSSGPNRLTPGISLGQGGSELYYNSVASDENIWILDFDSGITE